MQSVMNAALLCGSFVLGLGMWFHDSKSGTLYYHPPAGLDLGKALVEGVRLPHLVEWRGDAEHPVRFVRFQGIIFRHAARTFMENREPLLHSDRADNLLALASCLIEVDQAALQGSHHRTGSVVRLQFD